MRSFFNIIISLSIIFSTSSSFALEKVFYILHHKSQAAKAHDQTLNIIANHTKSINIIISQAFHIDKNGVVTGFIDPEILSFTHKHSMKLMAMVTNLSFDPWTAHQFLLNTHAQMRAIQTIIAECKQDNLYGVQFDFEMIPLQDRNLLTRFYLTAANQLHRNGFVVSFAVAPTTTDGPFSSSFQKRTYQVWQGAYDLKTLGKYADFVTVMAYNQHVGRITPGPNASVVWLDAVIKHVLKSIPAQKISLGIPTYSLFWYTGADRSGKIMIQYNEIGYSRVADILRQSQAKLLWDDVDKVHYTFYEHNWINKFLFIEDATSFRAKLALVQKYHLRGISVFRIDTEDPKVWDVLI